MSGITPLSALATTYLQNDARIDGTEIASLIQHATTAGRPDAALSAQIAEFADVRDPQIAQIARGSIPGAERLFSEPDLASLRRRVEMVHDPASARRLGEIADRAANAPVRQGNDLTFLVDGPEVYPEIRRMIRSARETLDLEFFIIQDDPTGFAIAQELIDAHKRGVRVNFLVDRALSTVSRKVIGFLRDNGVEVRTFGNGYKHPTLRLLQTIDHRKMLLVDGREGMTGGMNVGEPYEAYWHDVMVRVRGPVLQDLYREFATNWTASGGKFPTDAVALARERAVPVGEMPVAVHVTTPSKHQAEAGLMAAIDGAKDHIYINSPYFIDQPLVDKLMAAARRGVKVVAVVPNMTDVPIVDAINRVRIDDMVKAGVQVRIYDTTNPDLDEIDFMKINLNHAKVTTIDGTWTSIGTVNIDHRALRANQEINLSVTSTDFAHDIERRFFHSDAIRGRLQPAVAAERGWSWPIRRFVLDRVAPLL